MSETRSTPGSDDRRRTLAPIEGLRLPDDLPVRGPTRGHLVTAGLTIVAAIAALQLTRPLPQMEEGPFAGFLTHTVLPRAVPSATAFGASGEVKLKFALPGQIISYPLDVHGDPAGLSYAWTRLGDFALVTPPLHLVGSSVTTPSRPGFYRLTLGRGNALRPVDGLTVAVMVPFAEKEDGVLRGYRIGTYIAERISGRQTPPEGFLEITPRDVDIPITKHLRVGDFLNHDDQEIWPRYAAVSPRLLDKLELVVAEISRWHGGGDSAKISLDIDVHSGFRAPDHNRHVRRAASDSQHQYGDAADVVIDVNGDGKFTAIDARMVALATEIVELKHPELVGGLGLYTSGRAGSYVHIDARGHRARWRG